MLRTTVAAAGLLLTFSLAAGEKEKLESGCKKGDAIGSFLVRDVTGPSKGKTLCYT